MKKNNRRFTSVSALLLLFALLAGLAACGAPAREAAVRPTVICTLFPIYDWTRQLLGDRAENYELRLLLGSGTDLHSYEPTADDRLALSGCDLLICLGGPSDDWINAMAAERGDKPTLFLFSALKDRLKTEETAPGMQTDGTETAPGADEHVWLAPGNAILLCSAVADALCGAFPADAAAIRANEETYRAALTALQADYRAAADAAGVRTLLFADRFPFRYLTDELGLRYCAAFPGCDTQANASVETVSFLAEQLRTLELPCVLVTESADGKLADTVIRSSGRTDCPVLTLDSMQSVTAEQAKTKTYIGVMRENLAVLRTALNSDG